MKITKEITFDSAHMLSNYNGKCNNLHGHTYKLQIEVEGDVTFNGYEENAEIACCIYGQR